MAVVLFDGGYPSFWNVDSAISIDVVGMKSYMDSLFDLMCESGGSRSINLTLLQIGICPVSLACFSMRERVKEHDRDIRFAPKRNMPVSLACSETAEVWVHVTLKHELF